MAFCLELLGGLTGFLGVGWIYAGNVGRGVMQLMVWWAAIVIMWFLFFSLILAGADPAVVFILLSVLYVTVPTLSALYARAAVEEQALTPGGRGR